MCVAVQVTEERTLASSASGIKCDIYILGTYLLIEIIPLPLVSALTINGMALLPPSNLTHFNVSFRSRTAGHWQSSYATLQSYCTSYADWSWPLHTGKMADAVLKLKKGTLNVYCLCFETQLFQLSLNSPWGNVQNKSSLEYGQLVYWVDCWVNTEYISQTW